jgi:rubredoxin
MNITCSKCKHEYSPEESVRVRDLGAYNGSPVIEGEDNYVECPLCGMEQVVSSNVHFLGNRRKHGSKEEDS